MRYLFAVRSLSRRQVQRHTITSANRRYPCQLETRRETVAALKKQTNARIVVLGSVPWWKRGLPNEVLRYFMLHHRLMPERSCRAEPDGSGAALRKKLVPLGAEFISVWDVMCNAEGCLTRIGDTPEDIAASDQVHLTEKSIGVFGPVHSA
jgi:hypothetical protein